MVDGLEEKYGEGVVFEQKNWKDKQSIAEIKELGFPDGHGMVIRSADGTSTWQEPSHFQWKKPDEVEGEVKKVAPNGE